MYRSESIFSEDGCLELSASKLQEGGFTKYYAAMLEINIGGESDIWDNDEYLKRELFLWASGQETDEDFKQVEEYRDELFEMLKLAIELKML